MGRIASIPLLLWAIIWVIQSALNPSPEKIDQGGELIAKAATPWWIPLLEHAPAIVSGILIAVLVLVVVVAIGFVYTLLRNEA